MTAKWAAPARAIARAGAGARECDRSEDGHRRERDERRGRGVGEPMSEVARLREHRERRGATERDDARTTRKRRTGPRRGGRAESRARAGPDTDGEDDAPHDELGSQRRREPRDDAAGPRAARERSSRRERHRHARLHSADRVRGDGEAPCQEHGRDDLRRRARRGAPDRDPPTRRRRQPGEEPQRLGPREDDQRRCVRERREHERPRERRHAVRDRPSGVEPVPRACGEMPRVAHRD